MTDAAFIVTEASTWLARGRSPAEAAALAAAWRAFPDLPPEAPLAERMDRTRRRIAAMHPIIEAAERRTEAERQARNFAFVAARCLRPEAEGRERAILRARDAFGHDWNGAVRFAEGWYAARAGWPFHPPSGGRADRRDAERVAYEQGFRDGGGEPDDLFDAARRSLALAAAPTAPRAAPPARPLPSDWPKPTDAPRPAPWDRRLVILSEHDPALDGADAGPVTRSVAMREEIRRRSGGRAVVVLLSATAGFIPAADAAARPEALTAERSDRLIADPAQRACLQQLVAAGSYDDLLVAAQGEHLRVIDAFADLLPLCRCMERTRNTPLQQRAHLATWIDRAARPDGAGGAGHIRWGKAAKGLTARLAEFTARYAGADAPRRHRLVVEIDGGAPAHGYAGADGVELDPVVVFSSKARLRTEMATALRRFGGATRLAAAATQSRAAA